MFDLKHSFIFSKISSLFHNFHLQCKCLFNLNSYENENIWVLQTLSMTVKECFICQKASMSVSKCPAITMQRQYP